MNTRRFRSRSESPPRRTQIGEPFLSCGEWMQRVKKVVTGVRGQVEVYEIFHKSGLACPPPLFFQQLLKAAAELDGAQNVNGQVVEEEREEQEKNTESRMNEDQTKDLLNQISQQVDDNSMVNLENQSPRNATLPRNVGNESLYTTVVHSQQRKVRQANGIRLKSKTADAQVQHTKKKSSSSCSSGSGSTRAKRSRACMEITIDDSGSSSSSIIEDVSEQNCSTSSGSSFSSMVESGKVTITKFGPALLNFEDLSLILPTKSNYLSAGLLSNHYKMRKVNFIKFPQASSSSSSSSSPTTTTNSILPRPIYCEEFVFQKPRDYVLPFDVWCFGVINSRKLKQQQSNSSEKKKEYSATVLQNIFKYLSYSDLLSCRCVDLPLWSSEAAHAINQRSLLTITLKTKAKIEVVKTFQGQRTRFLFGSIKELSSKLENDEKGHEIWLTVSGNILQDSKPFIIKFASAITKLSFWLEQSDKVSPSNLQKLLGGLPNLNHLQLSRVPSWWKSEKKTFRHQKASSFPWNNSSSCLLPKVKTIYFGSSCYFYPELLISLFQITPNLNNIYNFPLICITNSLADEKLKLHKIRSVGFSSLSYKAHDQRIAQFSSLANISKKIKLQRGHFFVDNLSLQDSLGLCCKSWSRILENNKSTLEILKIEPCALAKSFKYPQMKAVQKLWLYSEFDGSGKFFGDNFNAGKTFPNLVEVTLESKCCTFKEFLRFLPENVNTQEYFRGVTTLNLKLIWFMDASALEKINRLFPDVTTLSIRDHIRRRDIAQVFRLWPKLTTLKMPVDLSMNDEEYCLDPIFSGVSAAKCSELRKYQEKLDIDLQSYRETLAVPDMTDLKELTLIFGHVFGCSGDPEIRLTPLLSHVAAFYGFQCVPDLKVTCAISFDNKYKDEIQQMLSPIEEYVNVNPNYVEPLGDCENYLW